MEVYVSLLASVGTVCVMYLLTNQSRLGWVVSLMNQVNWGLLTYLTGAWGLIPLNIIMVGLAIRGLYKWKPPR